ncbi:MAG TPA: heme peroxidase family protein [Herpetosiphonaceae bacterium]
MTRRHGIYPEDVVPPRSNYFDSGRFGRMFGELPPFAADTQQVRAALIEIGKTGGLMDAKDKLSDPVALITDAALSEHNPNNAKMTAGMTFLGQFIDHDITFDPTSSLERQVDPEHIANFRTPTLALDNLYGSGPMGSPHLYDQSETGRGIKFLVEPITGSGTPVRYDLPRNSQGTALIGDPRNDENLIVSQLHLAFLRFHNAVVDYVEKECGLAGSRPDEIFAEAQRAVRWHYQWLIIHEFLSLTCGESVVDDVLDKRKFYKWRHEPFVPVEFSVATYRFGHSQIRPSYRANFTGATGGGQLFQFIFNGVANHETPEKDDLSGGVRRPWRFIDWRTFFNFGDGNVRPNKKIDTILSSPLFALPHSIVPHPRPATNPSSLAQRNLLRHLTFSLPSGQRVARSMADKVKGITPLTEGDFNELRPHRLHSNTPLWYYILREASVAENGEQLGPVGARIVAEVFVGLIQGDSKSYLTQEPRWKPFLPTVKAADQGRDFTMVDLLKLAGVV